MQFKSNVSVPVPTVLTLFRGAPRTRRQHYRIYGRHNDQSPATRFLASAGNNGSKVPENATEHGVELEGSDVHASMSLDGDSECTTFY